MNPGSQVPRPCSQPAYHSLVEVSYWGTDVLWSGESNLKTAFLDVSIYPFIFPTSVLFIEVPAVCLILCQVLWLRGE